MDGDAKTTQRLVHTLHPIQLLTPTLTPLHTSPLSPITPHPLHYPHSTPLTPAPSAHLSSEGEVTRTDETVGGLAHG
jgi:hypothetical protein